MSPMPRVSVVIATYNYAHYLPAAIGSVLGQSLHDLELVVIDDGSTDDTPDVVRPYLADHRCAYEPIAHVGVTPAKNRGLVRARGHYLATLDSDDEWEPTKLERQISLFESNPRLGLVYGRRRIIDPSGRELGVDRQPLHRGRVLDPLILDNFICYSSVMIRRSVLDDVGILDESFVIPSDYDLWLRISLKYDMDYVDEPVVRYREHPGISRKGSWLDRRREIDRVVSRFLDVHGGREAIDPRILRRAEFLRCCSIGRSYRETHPIHSAWWYSLALARSPLHPAPWRGLAAAFLTRSGRELARKIAGSPGRS